MLKPQAVLDKINPGDTNIYALSILDKYENRSDDLDGFCLADFASNYVSKRALDVTANSEDLQNYTLYWCQISVRPH